MSRPAGCCREASLLLVLLLFGAAALAHPTAAYGDLRTDPPAPKAGAPFSLELELADLQDVPVEDASILAELRREAGDSPIITAFEETSTPGRYLAEVELPAGGVWQLLLRDRTYRQEEAQATLTVDVGGPPNGRASFVFPPTRTGPANLWMWLTWIVGIPIAVAVVVTVAVLTRSGDDETTDPAEG